MADPSVEPTAPSGTSVEQGKLEASNTGTAESAVRLVGIMRQFEMLQKAVLIGNDMSKQAIEQVAKVGSIRGDGMIRALYSAASGMKAQELNLDNIANNLANANTVGYKSRRAQFQDLMYQSVVAPGHRRRAADRGSHRAATGPGHARRVQRDYFHRRAPLPRPITRSTW